MEGVRVIRSVLTQQGVSMEEILDQESKSKSKKETMGRTEGGDPKDFNSVKFALFNVFRASCAAIRAGSAFFKSFSQSICLALTSMLILSTFISDMCRQLF